MQDPWLRLNHYVWGQFPQRNEVHNMVVGDLMVTGERRWIVPKIMEFIRSSAMAEAITSISLFSEDQNGDME
jgi:hypothetical protein